MKTFAPVCDWYINDKAKVEENHYVLYRGGWRHPPCFSEGDVSVKIERSNFAFGQII